MFLLCACIVMDSMVADVMVMLVAGLTIAIIAGAEVAPCPSDTVSVNLAATEDIQRLTDAMNCSGGGEYNVTWSNSLQLESRIKVSTGKHVTITGSSKTPTVTAAPHHTHDNISIVDVGDISGIFLVSDNSTLTIHKMVLDGGYSEDGGAVAVISSSYLNVIDCVFTNNNALNGGDIMLAGEIVDGSQHANVHVSLYYCAVPCSLSAIVSRGTSAYVRATVRVLEYWIKQILTSTVTWQSSVFDHVTAERYMFGGG